MSIFARHLGFLTYGRNRVMGSSVLGCVTIIWLAAAVGWNDAVVQFFEPMRAAAEATGPAIAPSTASFLDPQASARRTATLGEFSKRTLPRAVEPDAIELCKARVAGKHPDGGKRRR